MMNYDDYQELLTRFLERALSSREFQHLYLEKFKNEKRRLPENVFNVLDALFADVDAFCPDTLLTAELSRVNPNYYLDDHMLWQRVNEASELLREATSTQVQAKVP